MSDELTTGELGRRIDDIKETVHGLDEKVDKLTEVHATLASHAARLDGHDIELRDLKASAAGTSTRAAAWIAALAAVAAVLVAAAGYHLFR